MNCVRTTFEDGVIYDHVFSQEEMLVLGKSACLVTAIAIAEDWRKLVSRECNISESFITHVEWYSYNFKTKEDKK